MVPSCKNMVHSIRIFQCYTVLQRGTWTLSEKGRSPFPEHTKRAVLSGNDPNTSHCRIDPSSFPSISVLSERIQYVPTRAWARVCWSWICAEWAGYSTTTVDALLRFGGRLGPHSLILCASVAFELWRHRRRWRGLFVPFYYDYWTFEAKVSSVRRHG